MYYDDIVCLLIRGGKNFQGDDSMRNNDEFAQALQRRADRISALILFSDLPWVDIAIEINNLREWCRGQRPEKSELFEWVYVSRFKRLRDQWREDESL